MDRPRWILFADLDGTVLDRETYEPGPSLGALHRCREAGIEVVFSSSKTGAEVERYHSRYASHPRAPFISENGGGVFFPADYWQRPPGGTRSGSFWRVSLGAEHRQVIRVLGEACKEVGVRVRSFSSIPVEEIARRTGLSLAEARLAGKRDFDEPFWMDREEPALVEALREAIERRGMQLTRGGGCLHVHGPSDKGKAARYVQERYEEKLGRVRTAAVGDASNDVPMFRMVDRAYLVRGSGGGHDPGVPGNGTVRFVAGIGPAGFCEAVEDLIALGGTDSDAKRGSSR